MAEIRCLLPIRVRLTGELDEPAAGELTGSLAAALAERIALARHDAAEYAGSDAAALLHPPEIHVTGALDEEQERRVQGAIRDAIALAVRGVTDPRRGTLRLLSGGGGGGGGRGRTAPRNIPAARRPPRRPWIVRKAVNFHAYVSDFLYLVADLTPELAPAIDLYWEIRDELRWVELWLVQINRPYVLTDLTPILRGRASELAHLRPNQTLATASSPAESLRQSLIEIDTDGVVAREIRDLTTNASHFSITDSNAIEMEAGCYLLFAWMIVPLVTLADRAEVGAAQRYDLRLADVQDIFGSEAFHERYGIDLSELLAEFPDFRVTVVVLPVFTRRRTSWITLRRLMIDHVDAYEQAPGQRDGNLYLLNQPFLDGAPSAIRDLLTPHTDALTRALPEAAGGGDWWEADWRGAVVYAIADPSEAQINQAAYGPLARRVADHVMAQIALDPTELTWRFSLDSFLSNALAQLPPVAYELFLAELESRGALLRFIDAVVEADPRGRYGLLHHVIDRARSTRYATHPRVVALHRMLNEERRRASEHEYRIAEQEIWLHKDPGQRVRVGDFIADVAPIYSVEETRKELKQARRAPLRAAVEEQSRILVGQIERGEEVRIYDAEGFLAEVFARAAAAIHLSEDDFEDLEIERTFRLLGLEQRVEESLDVVYVTYDIAQRVNGGAWTIVPDSRTTKRDHLPNLLGEHGFELTLWFWGYNKAAVVVEAFAIGVTVVALVAVAWEVGLVALLVEAGGGATSVLIGVGLSTLIYLGRVIFTDENFSFEGLLMAALEGYLFTVGFRGAGIVGRGLARGIGTQTLRRLVIGWAVERLAVGTLGGAGSVLLINFTQDTINIILGRQAGYRSIDAYIEGMAWGALLGVVFEFGIGALAPVLRVGGATGLETAAQVAQRVRAAGLSAEAWGAMMAEALGRMRSNLAGFLDEALAGRITAAIRSRILETLRWYAGEARVGLFRRVLELAPEALSRGSTQGLERLLAISPRHLADQAVLDVLNSVTGSTLRRFLEAFGVSEAQLAEQIVRGGGLPAVARTPSLLPFVQRDVVIGRLVRELSAVAQPEAAARLARLLDVAHTRPDIPGVITRGVEVARGGTNVIYSILEDPNLLLKPAGGRMATEAVSLVELELLGIPTVYGSAIEVEGQTVLVMRRVGGVGSKDIIGRSRVPLVPPQHVEVVTQRTIDDLRRIRDILNAHNMSVRDFQFIVRESDGAVVMNDPTGLSRGGLRRRSTRRMDEIIADFEAILRDRQAAPSGGTP